MRTSTYEMVFDFEDEGTALLINGLSGAIDLVPLDLGLILKEHKSAPLPAGCVNGSLQKLLFERLHVTDKSPAEEKEFCRSLALFYEQKSAPVYEARRFVILPTYSCNLRCPYCYERDEEHAGGRECPSELMTIEQVDCIFSIMERFPYVEGKSQIELFGGEPLFSKTLPVVEHIVSKSLEAKRTIAVTTNGYEIDLFEELLGPTMISNATITIDGPKDVHNSRRVAFPGQNTFDKIISNVELCLSRGMNIRLRVNLDRSNLDSYLPLVLYFDSLGWLDNERFAIAYGLIKSLPGSSNPLAITDSDLFSYLLSRTDDRRILSAAIAQDQGRLLGNLLNNPYATTKTRFCGAVGSALFFSPDGRVYNCNEAIGQPVYSIGTFDSDLHVDQSLDHPWKSRKMPNIAGCLECPLVFLCAGGCAYRAIDCGRRTEPYCPDAKEAFESRLRFEAQLSGIAKKKEGGE